jgi:hypothetical protein
VSADANVTFVQDAKPPLAAGSTVIDVKQVISVDRATVETLHARQDFHVRGLRYHLEPSSVNSVFPPDASEGDFDHVLPHVLLAEPSLPWQRSPLPRDSKPPDAGPPAWFGLMLFDAADPAPDARSMTVGDLRTTNDVFFPEGRLEEPGESTKDPVTVIDVPVDLFYAIAPSAKDLVWLSHVRRISSAENKATHGERIPSTEYSVVFGNRLPAPGSASIVHLVSFEGWSDFLPRDDGSPGATLPSGTKSVRLVTLHSWRFSTTDEPATFAATVSGLLRGPATLQLEGVAAPTGEAESQVNRAYGMGYVAMDHSLRNGGSTVSWYRGPLAPLGVVDEGRSAAESSDDLLFFDRTTGMFDVSYAAAWELGRLLALRDRAFATALYRWKCSQSRAAAAAAQHDVVKDAVSAATGSEVSEHRHDRLARVLLDVVGPAATALVQDGGAS